MIQKTLTGKIKDNLAVILVMTSIITGCTWVQARLAAVEAKSSENEESLEQLESIKTNVYLLCISNKLECIK